MLLQKIFLKIFTFLLIVLLFGCKNPDKSGFNLIPRDSYFTDNYNGISFYRDNETRELMDGYFIVGDKVNKWEEFNLTEGVLNGDSIEAISPIKFLVKSYCFCWFFLFLTEISPLKNR